MCLKFYKNNSKKKTTQEKYVLIIENIEMIGQYYILVKRVIMCLKRGGYIIFHRALPPSSPSYPSLLDLVGYNILDYRLPTAFT